MAKYRFSSKGSFTMILRGTYKQVVRDEFNNPISNQTIPPLKLVFQNGFAETDDKTTADLVQQSELWGSTVFWHPSCLPKDAPDEDKDKAKEIDSHKLAHAKRRKKGKENALEGNVPKDR